MRIRSLAILFVILILVPTLTAQGKPSGKTKPAKHSWANVEKLKPGTLVHVELLDGRRVEGRIESADDSGLTLDAMFRLGQYRLPLRTIDRGLISQVLKVRMDSDFPDIKKWMIGGAIVGSIYLAIADAGTATGSVIGFFGGGFAGAMFGLLASAGVAIGEVFYFLAKPYGLVYQAPPGTLQPAPAPSS